MEVVDAGIFGVLKGLIVLGRVDIVETMTPVGDAVDFLGEGWGCEKEEGKEKDELGERSGNHCGLRGREGGKRWEEPRRKRCLTPAKSC